MKVTITGMPGAGKTTVSKILAKKHTLNHYYMGGMIRNIAKGRGMTIEEFYKKTDDGDKIVDEHQKKIGQREDNFIMEGRTSFHFIPDSLKVFLKVDKEVGATRIFKELRESNRRNEREYSELADLIAAIKERMEIETKRYSEMYGFNNLDESNYDLVIDTTNLTPEEVTEKISEHIK